MNTKAKRSSMDIISTMPENIIENILCLVPIKEAVRTSILSRKWKHNWITIPKLVFIEKDMFDKTTQHQQSIWVGDFNQKTTERITMTKRCKLFYAINQVLLLRHGPIFEFTLVMDGNDTCVEIDQIIIHLARNNNTVKKFKLEMTADYARLYRIPRSIFALNQLTDLYIDYCAFDFDIMSSGFPSLMSLSLIEIQIPKKELLHLLSNCPTLKSFSLLFNSEQYDEDITTTKLLNCLPVIEHLSYSRWYEQTFAVKSDPRELPSTLVHLKYFHLEGMMLIDNYGLEFVSLVIRSSPKLEKIKLEIDDDNGPEESEIELVALQDCSNIWLEHFKELEIVYFADRVGEMEFVKLILAKSPVLEKKYLAPVKKQHLEMTAKAKRVSLDRISNLPLNIIENILCLVPIRDAVRTSILSKNWRYNWVKIPKLVFEEHHMFDYATDENHPSVLEQSFSRRKSDRKQMTRTCKVFYAIHQVLLLHEGPILEFSLTMFNADDTCVEIDQIIIHLARNNNTLKKFTLKLYETANGSYQLPRSIFSLHHLTDLNIIWCDVDYGFISNGFGSLTSLSLMHTCIYKKALLLLLSNCPSLKCFELVRMTDTAEIDEDVTTIKLLNCLPMIERLSFYRWIEQDFDQNSNPRELPNALVHLKYFCLEEMMFFDEYGLDFLCLVMRSSPNLKKIELKVETEYPEDFEVPENSMIKSASLESCSDIWLEHLEELEIRNFIDQGVTMEFMKLILDKSPVLKKVIIMLDTCWLTKDEELKILKGLLACPRVSPLAEIIVESSRS